jgi:hypothetical protein
VSTVPDAVIKAAENVWLAAGWIKRPDGAWFHPKAHNPPPHKPGDLPPIALADFHNPRIIAALWEFFKVEYRSEAEKPPEKSPADILREKIAARAAALEERIAAVAAIAASAAATQAKLGIYGVAHRELVEESRGKLRDEIAALLTDIAGGNIGSVEGGGHGT